jgi:uncharacterized protein
MSHHDEARESSAQPIVVSHREVAPLLRARAAGESHASISPDLGLSEVDVTLDSQGARFGGGELRWADAAEIAGEETKCFTLRGDEIEAISFFSEATHWVRTLYPTTGAPTMLVSGISMHRIKGIDPWQDTLRKVRAIAPINGRVLDTATGLGYTAIEAAKTATDVVTIELDPAGIEVARLNPWSRELFTNPRIRLIIGDVAEEIEQFAPESFSRIIHDPPMFTMAGDLYGGAFYRQLYRVLKPNGRLFHYIGDLESTSNRTILPGVLRRLKEAGFRRVTRRQDAFGLVCQK